MVVLLYDTNDEIVRDGGLNHLVSVTATLSVRRSPRKIVANTSYPLASTPRLRRIIVVHLPKIILSHEGLHSIDETLAFCSELYPKLCYVCIPNLVT